MNIRLLLLILALPLTVIGASPQLEVTQTAHWTRTTIETYPEAERRPILNYLDAGKVVADSAATKIVAGGAKDVFIELQRTMKMAGQDIDALSTLAAIEDAVGTIRTYEYRAQVIEGYGSEPDVHDLARVASVVIYAVRTTRHPDSDLFLEIRTYPIQGQHTVVGVKFTDYFTKVPPWLRPKVAGTQ